MNKLNINLDKKQKTQVGVLVALVLGLGYAAVSLLSEDVDPRYLQNEYNSAPVLPANPNAAPLSGVGSVPSVESQLGAITTNNIDIVRQTVDVTLNEPAPEVVDASISARTEFGKKVVNLYEKIRYNKIYLENQKVLKEIAEIEAEMNEEDKPKIGFMPPNFNASVSVRTPQEALLESVSATSVAPVDFGSDSLTQSEVFSEIAIASMVRSNGSVSAWLNISGAAVRAEPNSYIGDFHVIEVSNKSVKLRHIPTGYERVLTPPGVGLGVSAAASQDEKTVEPGYNLSLPEGFER
ncbi:hypothetical protein ACP3V3_02115 [Vibrio sp. PNB22_3_1]